MYLSVNGAMLVLWLHVIAATVWIGGQITLAALVPVLRSVEGLPVLAARRFQWLAWTAFAVLIVTGVWNMQNAGIGWTHLNATPAGRTLRMKLAFVVLSGLGAAVHAYFVGPRASQGAGTRTRALSGIFAGVGLLAAVIAALYGVVIAQH